PMQPECRFSAEPSKAICSSPSPCSEPQSSSMRFPGGSIDPVTITLPRKAFWLSLQGSGLRIPVTGGPALVSPVFEKQGGDFDLNDGGTGLPELKTGASTSLSPALPPQQPHQHSR